MRRKCPKSTGLNKLWLAQPFETKQTTQIGHFFVFGPLKAFSEWVTHRRRLSYVRGSWRRASHCAHSTWALGAIPVETPGAHRPDLFPSEAGIMVALTTLGLMQTLQYGSAEALPILPQHCTHSDEIIRKCRGMRRTDAEYGRQDDSDPQQSSALGKSSQFSYILMASWVHGEHCSFAVSINWRTWTLTHTSSSVWISQAMKATHSIETNILIITYYNIITR